MASFYNTGLWNRLQLQISKHTTVGINPERLELINTLKQLSQYLHHTKNWNHSRIRNQRLLSWQQQNMLKKIGYDNKISKLDDAIKVNLKLVKLIVEEAKSKYQISYTDWQIGTESRDNFRVIELLCHYQRDWSSLGDVEMGPILEYIKSQIRHVDKSDTVVINPGSGLGRVAHELALEGFKHVQSIEYSMLMKLLNEFIYSPVQTYKLHPFIHNYSNQVDTLSQLREISIETLGNKPQNLNILYGDFNKFETTKQLQNCIIVTVFFIDTLENLLQYLETINKLTLPFPGEKLWINIGPLKYGTRPKVELNLKELQKLIKLMHWDFVDQQPPQLLGYLTDLQSMWQGQYGVSMFTCKRN